MGDEDRIEHRADDPDIAPRCNADAGSKACFDCELCGVFAGDEEAALLNELFQMVRPSVTEAGANVGVSRGAEVRRDDPISSTAWHCSTWEGR